MKSKLIAIVGPTATGKSDTAVALAARTNGEIISVDSAQVYRGLDIGSAKIKPSEMIAADGTAILHHLLDYLDPKEDYNIARFQIDAKAAIEDIQQRGKTPILCGGSGLYVHSLLNTSYQLEKEPGDAAYREELKELAAVKGLTYLYQRLQEEAPELAKKIHPNDEKRIIRALEKSRHGATKAPELNWESPYDLAIFGLYLPREILYQRIEKRIDQMLEAGLVAEVKSLLDQGVDPGSNALTALGYKEIIGYLAGRYDLEEAIRILKRDTRHFAKRQLTWFMRDPRIIWINITNMSDSDRPHKKFSILSSRKIKSKGEYL